MARKIDEKVLMEKAKSYLPKELKGKDVIASVDVDTFGNSDRSDGISYWVYLKSGYKTENGYGSHTIHEDNLLGIKCEMSGIIACPDDTDGY